MKNLGKLIVLITCLLCVGCSKENLEEQPPVTTTPYDVNHATELVKELEQVGLELSEKTSLTAEEYQEFNKRFIEQFNHEDYNPLATFIVSTEEENPSHYEINLDNFYPTVFYQDIEVMSASIGTNPMNEERLNVMQKYTGTNDLLTDFYRIYTFKLTDNDEWIFESLSGTLNYIGPEYEPFKVLKDSQ